jgi:hypothetical protein
MAYCANCGTQLSDTATACPECGHPRASGTPGPSPTPAAGAVGRTEGTAIASLVLGITGFFVCPLIFHVVAIILGNQAQNRIRENPTLEGEGLAKAGIILGWVGVGLSILGVVFFLLAFVFAASSGVSGF